MVTVNFNVILYCALSYLLARVKAGGGHTGWISEINTVQENTGKGVFFTLWHRQH